MPPWRSQARTNFVAIRSGESSATGEMHTLDERSRLRDTHRAHINKRIMTVSSDTDPISDQTRSRSHRSQTDSLISTYRAGDELPTNDNPEKEFHPQLTVSSESQPKSNLVHVVCQVQPLGQLSTRPRSARARHYRILRRCF